MSDITLNTKRFTSASGFDGASTNDLVRIAAQAIDYADEITDGHSMKDVIRAIREDADCIDADDDQFTFEYDGMTFRVVTEDVMESMKADALDSMVEEANYELDRLKKDMCYLTNYITIDEDMFRRDAEYDIDNWVSPYDGVVHEMQWNEYDSGDGSIVTRRETLYMIRED